MQGLEPELQTLAWNVNNFVHIKNYELMGAGGLYSNARERERERERKWKTGKGRQRPIDYSVYPVMCTEASFLIVCRKSNKLIATLFSG